MNINYICISKRQTLCVDVKDSTNLDNTPIDPANSIDSGNNVNWWTESDDGDGDDDDPTDDLIDPVNDPIDPLPSDEVIGIPDDMLIFWEDKEEWKKRYAVGKYKTVVIVYEGKVVAAPVDENGEQSGEEVELTAGMSATFEGEITEEGLGLKGFDYNMVRQDLENSFKHRYAKATYRSAITSIKGKFTVTPYDQEGPHQDKKITITSGETVVHESSIK